jgi:hypothetical protein
VGGGDVPGRRSGEVLALLTSKQQERGVYEEGACGVCFGECACGGEELDIPCNKDEQLLDVCCLVPSISAPLVLASCGSSRTSSYFRFRAGVLVDKDPCRNESPIIGAGDSRPRAMACGELCAVEAAKEMREELVVLSLVLVEGLEGSLELAAWDASSSASGNSSCRISQHLMRQPSAWNRLSLF